MARYHQAVVPAYVPRVIAVNLGEDGDPGDWFRKHGLLACAALANNDLETYVQQSDTDRAIARGVIIFVTPMDLAVADASNVHKGVKRRAGERKARAAEYMKNRGA